MPKTVIITSLLDKYILSACLIRTKHSDTSLIPTSRNGMAYHLDQLLNREDAETPEAVVILAIANADHMQKIAATLKKIAKRGIAVHWVGTDTRLEAFLSGIPDLHLAFTDDKTPIYEAVASHFGLRANSRLLRTIREIYGKESRTDTDEKILTTTKMAISRYVQFRDITTLNSVVESLAVNGNISGEFDHLITEFEKYGHRELAGRSPAIQGIKKELKAIAVEGNCSVLITGESGTGKESVAYQIHAQSPRAREPFVPFNCADLNPDLVASRLFGHEKGAFTGADQQRAGAFEQAEGGTLFLDEVGELPLNVQAGLLRVLQEKRFARVGGREDEVSVDVRIIAATNRSIPEMVRKRAFREDLFYRLNEVIINVPPLRERLEDLPDIVKFLSFQYFDGRPISPDQIRQLAEYHWPGNVRELISMLKRSFIFGEKNIAKLIAAHQEYCSAADGEKPSDLLNDAIHSKALQVYRKYDKNKSRAAKALGISVNRLKRILVKG